MKIYLTKIKRFRHPTRDQLRQLIEEQAGPADDSWEELSITFVGNEFIQELNKSYLQHDYPTDVIAFTLSDEHEPLIGDIYISVDQARQQAAEYRVSLAEEIVRLTAHGVLHVRGYDHQSETERERMTNLENEWIASFLRQTTP